MRLMVYEYACALPQADLPASIRAEGRAMRDAVAADAAQVPGVAVITVEAPSARDERLAFQAALKSVDAAIVIAPEFDGILEERCRWVRAAGKVLLGPEPFDLTLCVDKWGTYRYLKSQGLLTPRTWLPGLPLDRPPPYVVKHRFGAGSLAVTRTDADPGLAADRRDRIIQEYVPGQPVSCACLCGPGAVRLPLLPATQILQDQDSFQYLGGELPLAEPAASRVRETARRAVLGLPGLRGFVGVDMVLTEVDCYVIEINPRFTTSYLGLRALAETNLIAALIAVHHGESPPIAWRSRRVRFAGDGTLSEPAQAQTDSR